jgi:2,4-dienoyl-CoA reductase-like NADH-dependent reductase (Old Yellow Enzyme family)
LSQPYFSILPVDAALLPKEMKNCRPCKSSGNSAALMITPYSDFTIYYSCIFDNFLLFDPGRIYQVHLYYKKTFRQIFLYLTPYGGAMNTLFDKTVINSMTLENRLARSATWEGMCETDGRPLPKLISFYRDLARGRVGLIITGYAFVSPEGKQLPGQMGAHTDDFADVMQNMTRAVHAAGGKICLQLVHAGGQTDTSTAGRQPLAPSGLKIDQFPEPAAEMDREDIARVITAFGDGARRAREWGFDAVQLHGAHGYLINQFLSPLANHRQDEYGGSLENRCRFLLETYAAARTAVGSDFPVMVKLNGSDNLTGGLSLEDALYAAKGLASAGIDCIEVSGGTSASGEQTPVRLKIDTPAKEAYNLALAKKIRETVSCPIMVVGGFRSFAVAEKTIQESADYVSMARPFIREPGLAKRWQEGDRSKARCISCNGCFKPGLKEGGIYCVVEKKEQEKKKGPHRS